MGGHYGVMEALQQVGGHCGGSGVWGTVGFNKRLRDQHLEKGGHSPAVASDPVVENQCSR